MSYSLSQLDAIGDVDPVAEADVYLAYGRDLQAEEILKEAMRSNPERLAIRTKLLEVYAKRRDTKGFELLATQLYALTGGEGEDWAKAQELGLQIDPDNPLYQPGGAARAGIGATAAAVVEPLGASTMPQSVLPSPRRLGSIAGRRGRSARRPALDLDLDLDARRRPRRPTPRAPTRAHAADARRADRRRDADAARLRRWPRRCRRSPRRAGAAPRPTPARSTSTCRRHLARPRHAGRPAPATPALRLSASFGLVDRHVDSRRWTISDPLARKLELAEEFRQIGDMEGARDLLEEVVAKAERRAEDHARRACSTTWADRAGRRGAARA